MVSVAYMDPGNYSTAVAAGSAYQYKLLFSILLLNCLAIFLQTLSARLGSVTGLDLATNCRINLSPKVNIFIYIMAEIAIIATDVAEVVGTAIALNILFKIPLLLGVIITVIDVLVVLMAYRPQGPLIVIRIFELFVSLLVTATVICFGIELFQVSHDKTINFRVVDVIKGFLPNEKVIDMSDRDGGNGLFLSLAILGATVMPHLLYLGSGLVQSRLKDYDVKNGHYKSLNDPPNEHFESHSTNTTDDNGLQAIESFDTNTLNDNDDTSEEIEYRPSIHAINDTMNYTIIELVISLFTVALFVNSAILIVAGATLQNDRTSRDGDDDDEYLSGSDDENYQNADLFTIYHLLSKHLSPTAGLVFALALLFSGQSAGIVCTLAGQMVLEGFLTWSFPPVTRRLITRGLAILPCILVVTLSGRKGLSNVLNLSQVVLSILLPIVTAPLIIFTCSKEIMRVPLWESNLANQEIRSPTPERAGVKRFKSTQPAIKLQDLRTNHPCSGFDDDDHVQLVDDLRHYKQNKPNNIRDRSDSVASERSSSIQGYKDLSNGPITSFFAIVIWVFITGLNLFLIGSITMGYDVPL